MRVTPLLELVNSEGHQFGYGLLTDGEEAPFTCFYTSNISVPRDVLGPEPFHSAFVELDWEDTELGYRLNLSGVPIVYHAAARTRHLHHLDAKAFVRRQWRVGSRVQTLLHLHPSLASDQEMGLANPPLGLWLGQCLMAIASPVLTLADRLHVPIPRRIWRRALRAAFQGGRVNGERLRRRAAKAAS
jgi:GT2 family glycosyltransferase